MILYSFNYLNVVYLGNFATGICIWGIEFIPTYDHSFSQLFTNIKYTDGKLDDSDNNTRDIPCDEERCSLGDKHFGLEY